MIKHSTLIFLFFLCLFIAPACAQNKLDSLLPVRLFCIGAPKPAELDNFIKFIDEDLGPKKVNTLILRIGYNYQFKKHPELVDSNSLSKSQVKKIVKVCKKYNMRIIPLVNMLGHQSSKNVTNRLLTAYPQFDETPWVKMPAVYKWPNDDKLYCKSYCPLNPDVHKVLFDVIDEITEVFETDAFHAGMDEVFYLGEDKCPLCGGKDKAELFAGEVRALRNHLALSNKELWIWGDRLLDGKTTGLGIWEASFNNTYRAVDMIPKDVIICDWHYKRADQTPVYFAMKGFKVIPCAWNTPGAALDYVDEVLRSRAQATKELKPRFYGIGETVWSRPEPFIQGYYGKTPDTTGGKTAWNTYKVMFDKIGKLEASN